MSQETPIGNLSGGISDEDSKLVDSILNDINNSSPPQSQQPQQSQMTQEQMNNIQQQKMAQQQAMRQQAMAQQQAAMAQQQAMAQASQQKMNMIQNNENIMDNIKLESKNIMTIIFLSIIFNIDQVDNLFKGISFFVNESGGLNMQCVFLKALLIGVIFYVVKTYLL